MLEAIGRDGASWIYVLIARKTLLFLSCKEDLEEAHTGKYSFDYVDKFINEIRPQYVFQVVIDNVIPCILIMLKLYIHIYMCVCVSMCAILFIICRCLHVRGLVSE